MVGRRYKALFPLSIVTLLLVGCGGGGGSDDVASGAIDCATPMPIVGPGQRPISGALIQGRIDIQASARVDKDTAEVILAQEGENIERAELLPSSVVLGGYISAMEGTYTDHRGIDTDFVFPRDVSDRYCIVLEPGQSVEVQFFTAPVLPTVDDRVINSRVQLLRVSDGAELASTDFSPDSLKRVTLAPSAAPGTYAIDIATQGMATPTRYILSSSPTEQARNLHWARGDFVPGEAVVTLTGAAGVSAQSLPANAGMNRVRDLGNGQHKVTMPATLMAQANSRADLERQTIEWVKQLRERPDVSAAVPNYLFKALGTFSDWVSEPLYPDQWHYPLINLPQAWQLAPSAGNDVGVAVLDTGVFFADGQWHEDLVANLPPPGLCDDFCQDYIDDDKVPIDPGSQLAGSVYHGTHVAGTVAASGDNDLGGTGVAPDALILPVRVLDENGTGSLADIASAINWAVDAGAGVINMSLGSPADCSIMDAALGYARTNGVLVVAAAGNSPDGTPICPAVHPWAFGVGAVDGAGVVASYSNFGVSVDLVAPGGDAGRDANLDGMADLVVSASGDNSVFPEIATYAGLQGTSMATPHVAGVFALMKGLNPGLDGELVEAMLVNGELTNSPRVGRDPHYGYGVIDAAKAVQAAADFGNTLLLSSPSLLSFDSVSERTLQLREVGDTTKNVSDIQISISGDTPWLTATQPQPVGEDGYEATIFINRALLDAGAAHRGQITVSYRAADGEPHSFSVPVVVPIETPKATREAGIHFVLLIEKLANNDYRTAAQTVLASQNGVYNFRFEVVGTGMKTRFDQVEPGDYFLIAGTDLDNDGIICAVGEACAEYPIAGLREKITVAIEGGEAKLRNSAGEIIAPGELIMTTSYTRPLNAQSLPRPGFEGYRLLEPIKRYAPRTIAE